MSTRAASWLAWSLAAVSLLITALGLLLIFLGWTTSLPVGWTPWQGQVISALGISGVPILGGLIASRRPQNPYGWLWLGFGLAFALLSFAQVYAAYTLVVQPGALPAPRLIGNVMAVVGWMTGITLFPFLLLLFPTGRVPTRRWRVVAWAVVVTGVTALVTTPFMPSEDNFLPGENPLGVGGTAGEVFTIIGYAAVIVVLSCIVLSAFSLVFRYRRAGGVERQQLKWFAYAATLFVGQWISSFLYEPPGAWDTLAETLPIVGLYVAVGIAILRYRLYDIDVLINRTLVYGALTVTLVALYIGGVTAMQTIFRTLTGQAEQSQLAIVVSTLVIAALFNPVRRRIQGFIDRRFYRRKYDARKTLDSFSGRLRDETDLEILCDDLTSVVGETLQPTQVSLWLRTDPGTQRARAD
jgi:hypothetical protein